MMDLKAKKTKGKRSSFSKQIIAVIILFAVCLTLAATLITVRYITGMRKFELDGETYYIVREKDDKGKTVYNMTDKNKVPLLKTEDGYFVTAKGTLVSIDGKTGLANEYIRPDTEGTEQVGKNDRILIFPYTTRDMLQSIEVHNKKGSFSFYRMRTYEDTDKNAYMCILRNGEYRLLNEKGEEIKGVNGIFTLASGNEISIDRDTGYILTEKFVDFDKNTYSVRKFSYKEDSVLKYEYRLVDSKGNEVEKRITKYGEKTDKEGKKYDALLYDYYVTDFGTLLNVDKETGYVSSWAVREYNSTQELFYTYHFVLQNDKFVLCDSKGKLAENTALDDADYFRTNSNAYIAFNEDNGSYKVRAEKDYYIIADNDGVFSLYHKDKICAPDGSGYYKLSKGNLLNFDTKSGSHSRIEWNGEKYEEKDSKYLNSEKQTNIEGDFVIESFEETVYDPSLFAALVVSGGYTITATGGKLSEPALVMGKDGKPLKNADGKTMIDFSEYGLDDEKDNPAYYIIKDLDGNVHKISIGNKIISNAGYYVKYSSMDENGNYTDRQAVYILLDNYSTGYTQNYQTFNYYSITDTLLAPLESLVTPMVLYPTTQNAYFDVRDFTMLRYNPDKSADNLLNDNPDDDDDYYDVFLNFTFKDIEERRNSALATFPYKMGNCLLKGYMINSYSVDICLQTLKDLKFVGVSHLGVNDRDIVKYGLDVPEYVISFKSLIPSLGGAEKTQMLLISALTPNGTYYIYSETYDMIVEVKKEDCEFLSWDSMNWVTTDIYDIPLDFATSLKVESKDFSAMYNIFMERTLSAKVKGSASSNFEHRVTVSSDRKNRTLSLLVNLYANVTQTAGPTKLLDVDFSTLKNYYTYVTTKNTSSFTSEDQKKLDEFVKTINQHAEENGDAVSVHIAPLTDGKGQIHEVKIYFMYNKDGEITASISVNKEPANIVFSMNAYMAYEKVMFGDKDLTAEQKKTAFDFYLSRSVSANATSEYEKVTGENSNGEKIIFTPNKIIRTDKDGKTYTDYALGQDYKVFFDVGDNNLIGIGNTMSRFYYMNADGSSKDGKFDEIKDKTFEFEASMVRLILPENGKNNAVRDGTLGKGKFKVKMDPDKVVVIDENGNETRYLRYSGTSPFSSLYSSILWASYEGFCDIPEEQKKAFRESDDSLCQMKLTIETTMQDTYVFRTYQYSERRAYITSSGEGDFFVLRSFIDKILYNSSYIFTGANFEPRDKY